MQGRQIKQWKAALIGVVCGFITLPALAIGQSMLSGSCSSGDWDATRVVVRALDQTSQVLPFFMDPINIAVEGVGGIIGPNNLSLIGGEIAFWVKTFGNPGEIEITVKSATLGSKILAITVE